MCIQHLTAHWESSTAADDSGDVANHYPLECRCPQAGLGMHCTNLF